MVNNNTPVSGTQTWLARLKKDFLEQIENCISEEEVKLTVGWYLKCGISFGLPKEWLIESIQDNNKLYTTAKSLAEIDILHGRKPPLLREGDIVEVIVNARNITYHKGYIYKLIYHFDEKEWVYYIIENNKKVSKRYFTKDLNLIKKANSADS